MLIDPTAENARLQERIDYLTGRLSYQRQTTLELRDELTDANADRFALRAEVRALKAQIAALKADRPTTSLCRIAEQSDALDAQLATTPRSTP